MESYVFDIILITLAVIIVLHLIYNNPAFYPNTQESMANVRCMDNTPILKTYDDGEYRDEGTQGIDRTDDSKKWYHVANKLVTNDPQTETENEGRAVGSRLVFDDYYEGRLTSDPFDGADEPIPKTFGPKRKYSDEKYTDVYGNVCTTDETDVDMKRYIRDYVLDGVAQCGCVVDKSKSDFTRSEVDEYREEQLQFHDKINGTSAPAEDPVDKMNNLTLQGGIKARGQTIADYYDNLVNVRVSNLNGPGFIMGTSIPTDKCVSPPKFDSSSGVPQGYYTGNANAGGRYIMRDNWMYMNENPNNGGNLYDGITAHDPMIDNDRMI